MSWLTRSIGPGTFKRLAEAGLRFDAIELASANPTTPFYLEKARRLNDETYHLPVVGASDAHFVQAIGSACTHFTGRSAEDLRQALATGAVEGHTDRFPPLRDVGLRRARLSLTGQNLFVITPYEGFDPEVNTDINAEDTGFRALARPDTGVDYMPYPKSRTFTFGIELGL